MRKSERRFFSPPVYGGSGAVGAEGDECDRPFRFARNGSLSTSPVNGGGKRGE